MCYLHKDRTGLAAWSGFFWENSSFYLYALQNPKVGAMVCWYPTETQGSEPEQQGTDSL